MLVRIVDDVRQNFLNSDLRSTSSFLDNLRNFAILVLLELRTELVSLPQVVEFDSGLLFSENGGQRLLIDNILNDWGGLGLDWSFLLYYFDNFSLWRLFDDLYHGFGLLDNEGVQIVCDLLRAFVLVEGTLEVIDVHVVRVLS